jgi:hypothetical protein
MASRFGIYTRTANRHTQSGRVILPVTDARSRATEAATSARQYQVAQDRHRTTEYSRATPPARRRPTRGPAHAERTVSIQESKQARKLRADGHEGDLSCSRITEHARQQ